LRQAIEKNHGLEIGSPLVNANKKFIAVIQLDVPLDDTVINSFPCSSETPAKSHTRRNN
jgi:hypothetical protein